MNIGSSEWYHIRDVFLGLNHKPRNFRQAVVLAKTCPHPMAQWLVGIFNDKKVPKSIWELCLVFDQCTDAEAFTIRGLLFNNNDILREGAVRGSLLAQSLLLPFYHSWFENICKNHGGDPAVLYNLYKSFKTSELSLPYLLAAAQQGHLDAMTEYSRVAYAKFDSNRLQWFTDDVLDTRHGRFALNHIMAHYPDIPNQFFYHFGRLLKRRVNVPTVPVLLYQGAHDDCKRAVSSWLMVARRLGIVKDVRCVIGILIWKSAWKWMDKEDYMEQRKIVDFFKRLKNAS